MENTNIKTEFEYSTQKKPILLKEYGRNVQMLSSYLQTLENKDERSKKAKTLVELMRNINPSLKDTGDYYHKIWDHLFLITELELDVDSPYEIPEEPTIIRGEPSQLSYNNNKIRFRHYGKNTELLIKSAIEKEDEEEQFKAIVYIGRLMKKFYASWKSDNIDNAVIAEHISILSDGKLKVDLDKINENNSWDLGFQRNNNNRYRTNTKRPTGHYNKKRKTYSNNKSK